jgi:DNA (cytosine-5)-methyltransferase 1
MRYFSMFSGIGGFEYGIAERGECIGFSEINKYAIEVYRKHYPDHINFGDATKINPSGLPDFDFLCGGFPCQAFSIAGNRRGFQDTRGTLFFDIARILKVKRPQLVLLENVKGLLNHDKGETFKVIIQTLEELGYEHQWMVLNSKFHGVPQNRERVFIVGSLRGTSRPEILPFTESSGELDERNLREQIVSSLQSLGHTNGNYRGMNMIAEPEIDLIQSARAQHSRIYGLEGISPTLAGASKLSGDCTPKIAIPVLTPDRPEKRQNGRRFKEDGEPSFTLTGQDIHGVMMGNKIRRLTPTECERLQGFPDGWTNGLSDTQRYKCLGNAVTTNVIKVIVSRLIKADAQGERG